MKNILSVSNRMNRPRPFKLIDIKKERLSSIPSNFNDDEEIQLKSKEEYVEFEICLDYKIVSKRSIYHSLEHSYSKRQGWIDQLQNVVERINSRLNYDFTEIFSVEHNAYRLLFQIDQENKMISLQSLSYRGDIYMKEDSWVPL